jgi:hyperosmotically inducible periplasmic protein
MHKNRLHTSAPTTGFARLNRALALAGLLSAVAIAPQALANSVVGATPDDVALATVVQNALLKDKAFQDSSVDITVRAWQGKVNLSGWVANASDEPAARRIAASVGGVKSITTNLRSWSSDSEDRGSVAASSAAPRAPSVIGATPADLALASNVHAALLKDRTFQAADVDIVVRASNDKINLSGWIDDVNDDMLARKIAASVAGVKKVSSNFRTWSTDSDIHAASSGTAPTAMASAPSIIGATEADRALASEVRTAVMRGKAFQDADVKVVVRAAQGKVNLSGWVSFANNGVQARQIAATVPGVKSVTSDFKSWSSETDPRL